MTVMRMDPSAERWGAGARQKPNASRGTRRRLAVVALAVVALGSMALILPRLPLERWLPVQSVVLQGALNHVSEARLRSAIAPLLQGGLLGVDVDAIRLAVEALPWVAHATVHRVWPDTLRITLSEQVAVARWGEAALLNAQGKIFRPTTLPEGLPRLAGPPDSEHRVLRYFHQFHKQLSAVGLRLVGLVLDARRSWTAKLGNGAVIRIGREHIKARMRRFVAIWPRIAARQDRMLRMADLRYPNGFAIRWGKASESVSPRGGGK